MSPPQTIRRRRRSRGPVRWAVEAGVLLAIAGLMTGEFLVEGWLAPIVVSSGSMAPAILGPHRAARCPDCGMDFVCDAETSTEVATATCPNCGRRGIEMDPQIATGDRLLVDRATFGLRRPRRWEVALFRCPEHAGDYCVKRVVGLPGETIEIRSGDVYVDGAIARKSLDQQRAMAVLVHDTAWTGGQGNLPNRWSSQPDDGWQVVATGWRSAGDSATINWLNYIHWRRVPGAPPTIEEAPIEDEDSYNQTTSRQLNHVTDLILVGQLSARGHGTLLLKANDGRETFQLTIEPATGAVVLSSGDQVVQSVQAESGLLDRPTEILLSLVDRQLLFSIGGREQLGYPIDSLDKPIRPTTSPFSIGSRGLTVEINRLQIWRDVYYTSPTRTGALTASHLGPDEYFVLGDNSPISRDSRRWTGGEPFPASLLAGRPLRVFHHGADGK
jgi:signal peptidase I